MEAGWPGLSHPQEFGGQGLPLSLGLFKTELLGTANWSWQMYPGLALGAMNTILLHGTDAQKETFLRPLVEGRWLGTMCLTEPQCGTDLSQVKCRAERNEDGSYSVTGTKIFISSGDHDLTDNIVHVVLARLPDAPPGIKGISLFIVPKLHEQTGEPNRVVCSALEKKMGIKGSATAVLNFEGSRGYMLGPENKGMECMFTFMNSARIGTAMQGVCAAELSYQGAVRYAKERRSMRSLSGPKEPDKVADALIWHPDVRRMLLTQRAIAEGGRAMVYAALKFADHMVTGDAQAWKENDDKLGFMTPILKGFLTELGYEATNLGMQVFGGHGYIKEHGMEQIVRDTRIATLYEGTTGIQALDLLGRKVLVMTRGRAVREYTAAILRFCAANNPVTGVRGRPVLYRYVRSLSRLALKWNVMATQVMLRARKDRETVGAAAYDFMMFSGYVSMAFAWAKMVRAAYEKLENGGNESPDFYEAKIKTGEFYLERLLPREMVHAAAVHRPVKTLMAHAPEQLGFE